MATTEHLKQYQFKKNDARTVAAAKNHGTTMRHKLLKKLKTFDVQAWTTLEKLFASDKPELALEALKIWAKYRLSVLVTPQGKHESEAQLPQMSPEFAKRILEVLDS